MPNERNKNQKEELIMDVIELNENSKITKKNQNLLEAIKKTVADCENAKLEYENLGSRIIDVFRKIHAKNGLATLQAYYFKDNYQKCVMTIIVALNDELLSFTGEYDLIKRTDFVLHNMGPTIAKAMMQNVLEILAIEKKIVQE